MTARPKSCAGCRYVRRDWSWLWWFWCPLVWHRLWRDTLRHADCTHPLSVQKRDTLEDARRAVLGKAPGRPELYPCCVMRNHDCGLDAKLYEPRPQRSRSGVRA